MKKFERIFLYSVLAVLVFYVFLVDGNVESQVVIQEEIKARRIVIVNDVGQEVVELTTDVENNGGVIIRNKDGNPVAKMGVSEDVGGVGINYRDGTSAVYMGIREYGGGVAVCNKVGTPVAAIMGNENDNGVIEVFNKSGEIIGNLP